LRKQSKRSRQKFSINGNTARITIYSQTPFKIFAVPEAAATNLSSRLNISLSKLSCPSFTTARGTSASEEYWE